MALACPVTFCPVLQVSFVDYVTLQFTVREISNRTYTRNNQNCLLVQALLKISFICRMFHLDVGRFARYHYFIKLTLVNISSCLDSNDYVVVSEGRGRSYIPSMGLKNGAVRPPPGFSALNVSDIITSVILP